MSEERLAELRKLAEDARPDPANGETPWEDSVEPARLHYVNRWSQEAASFCAAASPDVVLALLAEVDRLRAASRPVVRNLGVVEYGHEHIGYRECVECLGCGFTYSAEHSNDDGSGYTCSVCCTNKSPSGGEP